MEADQGHHGTLNIGKGWNGSNAIIYNKYDKYVIVVVMNVHLPATSGFVRVPAF